MKVVYTAYSSKNFRLRARITRYVINRGMVPVNPFLNFDYFLMDTIDKETQRELNFELIRRVDEVWVFGELSDGVREEIDFANSLNKPVRYVNKESMEREGK